MKPKMLVFGLSLALGALSTVYALSALCRKLLGLSTLFSEAWTVSFAVYCVSFMLYISTFNACRMWKVHIAYLDSFSVIFVGFFMWGA